MINPNHQAFPRDIEYNIGMTIRAYFAAAAMQGLLADHKDHDDERYHRQLPDGTMVYEESCPQAVARLAVEQADALIEALNKPLDNKA